jgi:hypothetical protein
MLNGAINGTGSLQTVDGSPPKDQVDLPQLRKDLKELVATQSENYFQLAAMLTKAFELSAHKDWDYPTWEDFVDQEIGMGKRKSQYLMSIHHWFVNVIKSKRVIKKVQKLGWSKVRLLKGIVDKENVDEWVERAQSMTYSQLDEFIKRLRSEERNSDGQGSGEDVRNITFKLFPAQEQSLEDAIEVAAGMAESDKRGHCLALICDDFTASNRFNLRPGQRMMTLYLQRIANQLDVNLVASERGSGDIITGKNHVMSQAASLSQKDTRELIVGLTNEENMAFLTKKERKQLWEQLSTEFAG